MYTSNTELSMLLLISYSSQESMLFNILREHLDAHFIQSVISQKLDNH